MFITVRCSEEKCFIAIRTNHENQVCGCEYYRVRIHIIAYASQQIPALSRTFNLNFQDQNHFPGMEILQKNSKSFQKLWELCYTQHNKFFNYAIKKLITLQSNKGHKFLWHILYYS